MTQLMDRFVEFSSTWFGLILLATWRALPILVIVMGIGLALRRRLSPSLQALLLTIVVVRLLIPISVASPLSLHKPIDGWFTNDTAESNRNQQVIDHDRRHSFLPNVDQTAVHYAHSPAQWQSPQSLDFTMKEVLFIALMLIVISISIGLLIRSISSHVQFALLLRSCRLLDDRPLIDLLLRECDCLAVGKRPVLREVPAVTAPAVFGLFRQTICLPPGLTENLSEQELRWVIRHELAHIRRRDIPIVMIASIAGAFHWFNPIVWVLISRLRAAMEAAADRLALQSPAQNEVSAYGELLLRFAQVSMTAKQKSPTLGLISFATGKRLKQRVELLMRTCKPSGLSTKLLSAGLAGAIAFVGLTDGRETIDLQMPEVHLVSTDSTALPVTPLVLGTVSEQEFGGPKFVATYDLTSILETVPTWIKSEKKTPLEQLTTYIPLPPWMKEKLQIDGNILSAELTATQHQLLKQTLDIWKDGEPGQITIETRFIQTSTKTASSINWAERRIDDLTVRGLGPAIAARIEESELAQLIRTVSSDPRGNILLAPKVTLYDGQTGFIADQVQRPFVTGVDPKADGRMHPVVSVVDEGLSFVLKPKAGDDDSVTLDFKVKASSIGKVSYANLPLRTSNNSEPQFTVQVPATEQYEVSSAVRLAVGESVVVAIPRVFNNEPGADAETTMIVALTPRIIDIVEVND